MRATFLILVWCLFTPTALNAQQIDPGTVIVEVGDIVIRYADIRCIEGVRGTDVCGSHESAKLKEQLGTAFIQLGAETSGVELTEEELREIATLPSPSEQKETAGIVASWRCGLARALAVKRDQIPASDDCGMDEKAHQKVLDQYTINDLERVLAKDLLAELYESVRRAKTRSALYRKVWELRGESAESFWSELYSSQIRFLREEYLLTLQELIGEAQLSIQWER